MTSKVKRQRTVAKDDDILALIQDARVIWGREKDVKDNNKKKNQNKDKTTGIDVKWRILR